MITAGKHILLAQFLYFGGDLDQDGPRLPPPPPLACITVQKTSYCWQLILGVFSVVSLQEIQQMGIHYV